MHLNSQTEYSRRISNLKWRSNRKIRDLIFINRPHVDKDKQIVVTNQLVIKDSEYTILYIK